MEPRAQRGGCSAFRLRRAEIDRFGGVGGRGESKKRWVGGWVPAAPPPGRPFTHRTPKGPRQRAALPFTHLAAFGRSLGALGAASVYTSPRRG